MTAPDPRDRGLDAAHVLGVCELATDSGGDYKVRADSTANGVRVAVPTRQAAADALTALTLTGYQAIPMASGGRGRALLVTGWSPAGLDARLTTMRSVIHQLESGLAVTASAAIDRVRRGPARSPAGGPDTDVLAWARARLRAWVAARSGIRAPHDPAIMPADLGNALRLRAAWAVEAVIDDLIERHLRVAGHALRLFGSLRQHASDDWAQETAVRQAGITFHLSGPAAQESIAQDSSALVQRAGRPQGTGRPPSEPKSAGRTRSGPARTAASDIPRAASDSLPTANPAAIRPAGPGGGHFPATRPGRSR